MRKIIAGKVYDTKNAEFIGSDQYGNAQDFKHWYEALYRTKHGKLFLYGEGGPATKYKKEVGCHTWSGGETLILMSESEARLWAEEHLTVEEYEDAFGPAEEG